MGDGRFLFEVVSGVPVVADMTRTQAEGGQLLLVIPAPAVLRVFALTAMDRMIPNFTSLDQALAQTS
jgi:anti-anti-sigma regulatory factor